MALLTVQRSSSAGSAAPPQQQQPPHAQTQQQQPDTNSNSGSSSAAAAGSVSTTTTASTTTTVTPSADASSTTTTTPSDLAGLADEEDAVTLRRKHHESYFAGRGQSRLVGGGTVCDQFLTSIEGQPLSSIRGGTNLNIAHTTGCDIQQHLQSMFYLLRKEETLKMAVKLETQRSGRTRYLVVVSRPTVCHQSSAATPPQPHLMNNAQGSRPERTTSQPHHHRRSNSTAKQTGQPLTEQPPPPSRSHPSGALHKPCDRPSDVGTDEQQQPPPPPSHSCDSSHICNEAEESCLLGIDCNEKTTVGLVLRIQADTTIRLDGDGGFSISVNNRTHIFKPVSVQSMWSALQTLHKVSKKARKNNYYPGGPSHEWAEYYENRIESERSCLNEWHAMDSLESRRPPSPDAIRNKPTQREETKRVIKTALKEIMMSVDLDEVTSKYIRSRLEEHLDMDLGEFKSFIDEEMLIILGQMDAPTKIFDHVYLGSEWNASNLEELQKNGVGHILNVTREIDNFFPGMFDYLNVRVYDDEKTNLLKHWDNTYKYITRAGKTGSKVLVHCKMGVSRSASVVIAYAMKAYCLNFHAALERVKQQRNCIKPNKSFLQQLETYQGMLDAMKNKEKLQRSKSETNLRTGSTKDGRLLPGSEPTPLIQALNSSATLAPSAGCGVGGSPSMGVASHDSVDAAAASVRSSHIPRPAMRRSAALSDGRKSARRPASWSPDHVEASVALAKQQSQSLENLMPERKAEKTKNVLLPCSNGQNYSVSQNQVVHLQENVPSVKLIVSELESNKERSQLARTGSRRTVVGEMESFSQSASTHKPPSQINQLESKSQTYNNKTSTTNHQLNNNHHHNNNNNPLCDSPAWTSCPSTFASSTTSSYSSSSSINLSTTTAPPATAATILTSAPPPSHHPTNNHSKHHHSTETHFYLSESTDQTGSDTAAAAAASSSPSNVPRRRDLITFESSASSPHSPTKPISSRHSSGGTISDTVSSRPHHHHHHRDPPSRHASWGSADTSRTLPCRNSSLGSFDMRPSASSPSARYSVPDRKSTSSSVFPYDRDEIPWHPGTVKRTKQKIENSAVVKRKCGGGGQQPECTDPADKATPAANVYLFTDQNVPPSLRHPQPGTMRSHSEELLPAGATSAAARKHSASSPAATVCPQRLSASAPETSTIGCLTTTKKRAQSRMGRSLMPQCSLDGDSSSTSTLLEPGDECPSTIFASTTNTYGIVQNLKQNFEACRQDAKKKVKSLPSSPIAAHPDKSGGQCDRQFNKFSDATAGATQEERNVRGLVDRYEVHRSGTAYTVKPRPRSEYITNTSFTASVKPHMISHATIFNRTDDFRRPPVPPPTVRNALGSSSIFGAAPTNATSSTASTAAALVNHVSSGASTLSYRKMQQQHGKTHPLSRLSLNNPLLNTATYNTM